MMQRKYAQQRARAHKIELCRSYRTGLFFWGVNSEPGTEGRAKKKTFPFLLKLKTIVGDLPDIELSLKDIFDPLLKLAALDPTLSRLLLTSIVNPIWTSFIGLFWNKLLILFLFSLFLPRQWLRQVGWFFFNSTIFRGIPNNVQISCSFFFRASDNSSERVNSIFTSFCCYPLFP